MTSGSNLDQIALKIVHKISEIRLRSLESLQFKLSTGLLSIANVSSSDLLMENIITWFILFKDEQFMDFMISLLCSISEFPNGRLKLRQLNCLQVFMELQSEVKNYALRNKLKILCHNCYQETSHTKGIQNIDHSADNVNSVRDDKDFALDDITIIDHENYYQFIDQSLSKNIKLSVTDRNYLQEFSSLLEKVSTDNHLNQRLYQVYLMISKDFNSLIFLQESQILFKMLDIALYNSHTIGQQCLLFVSDIFKDWSIQIQKYEIQSFFQDLSLNGNYQSHNLSRYSKQHHIKDQDLKYESVKPGQTLFEITSNILLKIIGHIGKKESFIQAFIILQDMCPLIKLSFLSASYQDGRFDMQQYFEQCQKLVGKLMLNTYNDQKLDKDQYCIIESCKLRLSLKFILEFSKGFEEILPPLLEDILTGFGNLLPALLLREFSKSSQMMENLLYLFQIRLPHFRQVCIDTLYKILENGDYSKDLILNRQSCLQFLDQLSMQSLNQVDLELISNSFDITEDILFKIQNQQLEFKFSSQQCHGLRQFIEDNIDAILSESCTKLDEMFFNMINSQCHEEFNETFMQLMAQSFLNQEITNLNIQDFLNSSLKYFQILPETYDDELVFLNLLTCLRKFFRSIKLNNNKKVQLKSNLSSIPMLCIKILEQSRNLFLQICLLEFCQDYITVFMISKENFSSMTQSLNDLFSKSTNDYLCLKSYILETLCFITAQFEFDDFKMPTYLLPEISRIQSMNWHTSSLVNSNYEDFLLKFSCLMTCHYVRLSLSHQLFCSFEKTWLIEGNLQWLFNLIDSKTCLRQNHGLQILAQFVIITDSYQHILKSYPSFLDRCFQLASDLDSPPSVRQSATKAINNFIFKFQKDNLINNWPSQKEFVSKSVFELVSESNFLKLFDKLLLNQETLMLRIIHNLLQIDTKKFCELFQKYQIYECLVKLVQQRCQFDQDLLKFTLSTSNLNLLQLHNLEILSLACNIMLQFIQFDAEYLKIQQLDLLHCLLHYMFHPKNFCCQNLDRGLFQNMMNFILNLLGQFNQQNLKNCLQNADIVRSIVDCNNHLIQDSRLDLIALLTLRFKLEELQFDTDQIYQLVDLIAEKNLEQQKVTQLRLMFRLIQLYRSDFDDQQLSTLFEQCSLIFKTIQALENKSQMHSCEILICCMVLTISNSQDQCQMILFVRDFLKRFGINDTLSSPQNVISFIQIIKLFNQYLGQIGNVEKEYEQNLFGVSSELITILKLCISKKKQLYLSLVIHVFDSLLLLFKILQSSKLKQLAFDLNTSLISQIPQLIDQGCIHNCKLIMDYFAQLSFTNYGKNIIDYQAIVQMCQNLIESNLSFDKFEGSILITLINMLNERERKAIILNNNVMMVRFTSLIQNYQNNDHLLYSILQLIYSLIQNNQRGVAIIKNLNIIKLIQEINIQSQHHVKSREGYLIENKIKSIIQLAHHT